MVEWVERTAALILLRPGRTPSLDLPSIGRFTERDGLLLARTAPHQVHAMRRGADRDLLAELAPSCGNEAGLVDLSDARVGARLAGPDVRDCLARLVPLDMHPDRFAVGQCAATLMAHLNVLLLRTEPDEYELQCGRSFAGSFERALA